VRVHGVVDPAARNFTVIYINPMYYAAMSAYRIDLHRSDEGYSSSCPELPGCWSQGKTEAEALANIQIAIQEYVDAAEELAN